MLLHIEEARSGLIDLALLDSSDGDGELIGEFNGELKEDGMEIGDGEVMEVPLSSSKLKLVEGVCGVLGGDEQGDGMIS